MVTIEELKLGNRTLEALKFLLSQTTELETAISQININEIKDANTLTKEQIATLQDVKNAVEAISSDLSLKKSDFDEKKADFDSNMNAFRNDKADFDEKKADFDEKNNTALSNFAFIASNVEKINSTSALLAEAKNILETIKPIEQRTQATLNTIANSQAKFAELDALKATLLELKRSLESISITGLIKDDSASSTTTYSSQKLDSLLNKKLDISEKEAMFSNGKIKAEILPDINATTLNGKRATEFELANASTTKYNTLNQSVEQIGSSLNTLTNALENKIDTSLKGVANGVATLDNGGKLEHTQIPTMVVTLENFEQLVVDTVNAEGFTLGYYVNKNKIVQELGEHNDLIMSQKAVSDALKNRGMPVGSYMLFSSNSNIPDGFLRCDGSALDKTTYAALFTVIGYTYGRSGDKFLLPNFSDGKFMRATGGNAAALGTAQGDAIRNIQGELRIGDGTGICTTSSASGAFTKGSTRYSVLPLIGGSEAYSVRFSASSVVPTANENRPYNMAVVVLIKY